VLWYLLNLGCCPTYAPGSPFHIIYYCGQPPSLYNCFDIAYVVLAYCYDLCSDCIAKNQCIYIYIYIAEEYFPVV
jgi:hypothetical protein